MRHLSLLATWLLLGCGGGTLYSDMSDGRGAWLVTGGNVDGLAMVTDGPQPPLTLLWSQDIGSPPVGGALLAGRALLQVSQAGRIVAFDLETGEKLGRKGQDASACGPGVILGPTDNLLLLPEAGKKPRLRAYDRRTRKVAWQIETRACAPLMGRGDTVLVVTESRQLLALHSDDGQQLWAAGIPLHPTTGVVIAGDKAIVGATEGALIAFALADGSMLWQAKLGATNAAVRGQPLVSDHQVFAATADGQVWSVSNSDGKIEWSADIGGLPASGMSLSGPTLIVGSSNRRILGLSSADGRQIWRQETGGIVRGAPASTPLTTYVASSDGLLQGIDVISGKVVWTYELDAPVLAPVLLARDLLSVTTQAGTIYLFAAQSALR